MDTVIAIVGPTAVGKTRLSIALAKALGAEIISSDAMQFYRGLDIGTAKIKDEEMAGVPHHLIDILEPESDFSVAVYQTMVRDKIFELQQKNCLPILVGGSGLYVSAILYDYRFLGDKRDEDVEAVYDHYTIKELAELLKEISPSVAAKTDLKNRRRLLRALAKSEEEADFSADNLYYKNAIVIGLDMDRDRLYERIERRVDKMIEQGLEEEAKQLYQNHPDTQAAMAIGYKEFFQYFEGKMSHEEAVREIKKNSRRYAKKQLTWFRNKLDCFWLEVDPDHFDRTIDAALEILQYIKK